MIQKKAGLAARQMVIIQGGMMTQGVPGLRGIDAAADCSDAVFVASAAFRQLSHHDRQVSFVAIVNET